MFTNSVYITIYVCIFPHTLAYIAVSLILGGSYTFQWKSMKHKQ